MCNRLLIWLILQITFIFINEKYIYFASHSCNKLTKSWASRIKAGTPAVDVKIQTAITCMLLKKSDFICKQVLSKKMEEVGWVVKYRGKCVIFCLLACFMFYFFFLNRQDWTLGYHWKMASILLCVPLVWHWSLQKHSNLRIWTPNPWLRP